MRGLVLLVVVVGVVAGQDQPQLNEGEQQFQKAAEPQPPQQQFYYTQPGHYAAGYNSYAENRNGVGISAGIGAEPLDLSPYSPGNLITTMVYALGILSLVNLLLGLIPEAEARAAVEDRSDEDIEALEETVEAAIKGGEELNAAEDLHEEDRD